jgi:carboxylate-amine ligase
MRSVVSPPSTIGVEEEFLLLDPETRAPAPAAERVIVRAATTLGDLVSGEFARAQLEVKTQPCSDATRLRDELVRLRATAAAASRDEGVRICAAGTPVIAAPAPLVVGDHPRYRAGLSQYRAMLDDFLVCAVHVHIHVPDRETAVLAGNHLRPWLPLLVALSANSPFHQGEDTGYADWRAVIRSRFPCLGPPPYAESLEHHKELAAAMAKTEAMLQPDLPLWDVRPNPSLPTLEVRSMDVNADVDDTRADRLPLGSHRGWHLTTSATCASRSCLTTMAGQFVSRITSFPQTPAHSRRTCTRQSAQPTFAPEPSASSAKARIARPSVGLETRLLVATK